MPSCDVIGISPSLILAEGSVVRKSAPLPLHAESAPIMSAVTLAQIKENTLYPQVLQRACEYIDSLRFATSSNIFCDSKGGALDTKKKE